MPTRYQAARLGKIEVEQTTNDSSTVFISAKDVNKVIRDSLRHKKTPKKPMDFLTMIREQEAKNDAGWLRQLAITKDNNQEKMVFMFLRALLTNSHDNHGFLQPLYHAWGIPLDDENTVEHCLGVIFPEESLPSSMKDLLSVSFMSQKGHELELYERMMVRKEQGGAKGWVRTELSADKRKHLRPGMETNLLILQYGLLKGRSGGPDPCQGLLREAWGIEDQKTVKSAIEEKFIDVVFNPAALVTPRPMECPRNPFIAPTVDGPSAPLKRVKVPRVSPSDDGSPFVETQGACNLQSDMLLASDECIEVERVSPSDEHINVSLFGESQEGHRNLQHNLLLGSDQCIEVQRVSSPSDESTNDFPFGESHVACIVQQGLKVVTDEIIEVHRVPSSAESINDGNTREVCNLQCDTLLESDECIEVRRVSPTDESTNSSSFVFESDEGIEITRVPAEESENPPRSRDHQKKYALISFMEKTAGGSIDHLSIEELVCVKADAFDKIGEQIESKQPSPELQTMAHHVLDSLSTKDCDIVELRTLTANGKVRNGDNVWQKLFKPRKTHSALKDEPRRVKRSIQRKAKALDKAANFLTSNDEEAKVDILAEQAALTGHIIVKTEDIMFDIPECIAFQRHVGTTRKGLLRIDQGIRWKVPSSFRMFPTQLSKKLREHGLDNSLKPVTESIALDVVKGEKAEECVFWYLPDPARALELLTEHCVLSKTLQQSIEFSKLENKLLVCFGGDRGGGDFTMLIRVLNRKNGNAREHCQPICRYEDGTESYDNLAKTVYSGKNPIKNFLQRLVDDVLHAIVLTAVSEDEGTVFGAACLMIQFDRDEGCAEQTDARHRARTLGVSWAQFAGQVERCFDDDDFQAEDTDRKTPSIVKLERGTLPILSLVRKGDSDASGEKEYIGLQILNEDLDVVLSHRFPVPLVIPETGQIKHDLLHVIGFPSQDTKQALIVAGQGQASSSYPCLWCMEHFGNFTDNVPSWESMYDPNNPILKSRQKDAPLRIDKFSNEKMCKIMQRKTGNNNIVLKGDKLTEARQDCRSVVRTPHINIAPHKNLMGLMHATQGVMTHLCDANREQLRWIDVQYGDWHEKILGIKQEVEDILKQPKTIEWKKLHREIGKLDRKIVQLALDIEKEEKKPRPNRNKIRCHEQSIRRHEETKEELANDDAYGPVNKTLCGAEIMKELIDDYMKPKCKKPRGPAEYVFNKGIEIYGRVRYRAEHSGYELSNSDGIKALAVWDDICGAVCRTYGDQPTAKQLVESVMEESKRVAGPLLEVSIALKSQERIDPEKQDEIKASICALSSAWRECYPDKKIFLKFHHVEAHVIVVIEMYEMAGRGSEESFEASHPLLNEIKKQQARVASTERRIANEVGAVQSTLCPEVAAKSIELKEKFKGKRRGPYKTSGANRNQETLTFVEDAVEDVLDYVVVEDGAARLKAEWVEAYQLCRYNKVPQLWSNAFETDDSLGATCKNKLKYV